MTISTVIFACSSFFPHLYIQSVEFNFKKSGMAFVHFSLLIYIYPLIIFVSCHPPRPAPDPEITPPMQCLGWCVAKCLAEHADKDLVACQSDCRPYGQISLCVSANCLRHLNSLIHYTPSNVNYERPFRMGQKSRHAKGDQQ